MIKNGSTAESATAINEINVLTHLTQQLKLFPEIQSHSIIARTILRKITSRKSNNKTFPKILNATFLVRFAIWDLLSN